MSYITAAPVGERDKDGNHATDQVRNEHTGLGHHGVMATDKKTWRSRNNAMPKVTDNVRKGTIDTLGAQS